jgi:hypothetical protein
MTEYIDAPIPFIIGMPRKIWQKTKMVRGKDLSWLGPDITIYNIDKGKFKSKYQALELPQILTKQLLNDIQAILRQAKGLSETQLYEFWIESTLRLKISFIKFYIKLLDSFPQYFTNSLDTTEYLKSISTEKIVFMREFTMTQCFSSFIEKVMKARQENNDLLYFLQLHEMFYNAGEEAFRSQTEIMHSKIINHFKHVYILGIIF